MWGGPLGGTVVSPGTPSGTFERNKSVMTYSVLMGLASQREEQIAARARLPRPEVATPTATTRRTGKRDRGRVSVRLRTLVSRA